MLIASGDTWLSIGVGAWPKCGSGVVYFSQENPFTKQCGSRQRNTCGSPPTYPKQTQEICIEDVKLQIENAAREVGATKGREIEEEVVCFNASRDTPDYTEANNRTTVKFEGIFATLNSAGSHHPRPGIW